VGLRATIHQRGAEAFVALGGEFCTVSVPQLGAIFNHLHSRGCRRYVVDLTGLSPMPPALHKRLSGILGLLPGIAGHLSESCAVRHLADSPAARPQPGCGVLSIARR
jgi:hypothetical protein